MFDEHVMNQSGYQRLTTLPVLFTKFEEDPPPRISHTVRVKMMMSEKTYQNF